MAQSSTRYSVFVYSQDLSTPLYMHCRLFPPVGRSSRMEDFAWRSPSIEQAFDQASPRATPASNVLFTYSTTLPSNALYDLRRRILPTAFPPKPNPKAPSPVPLGPYSAKVQLLHFLPCPVLPCQTRSRLPTWRPANWRLLRPIQARMELPRTVMVPQRGPAIRPSRKPVLSGSST